MEDLFAILFGLIIAAAAIAAYVGLVLVYFVFVAPVLILGVTLYVAGDLLAGYARQMHGVFSRTPEFTLIQPYRPGTPENGPEPAYRQYFFGPAMRDLRQIVTLGWQRSQNRVRTLGGRFTQWTMTLSATVPVLFTWPLGVTLWIGLGVGSAAGAVLGSALAALHAFVVVAVQFTARVSIAVLRAMDTAVLYLRGVRGMRCPWCYEKNTYPAYRCTCNRLHRDIRPGRYGVLRRRCECGERMPTLILLGSYRMSAFCVYCDHQMSDETGRFRELVLPLLGGRAAGKTRLMAAMLVGLHELADHPALTAGNVGLHLASTETQAAFEVLSTVLDDNGYILATTGGLPHAHAVQLRMGRRTRLVHIFDPAGERLIERDRTDELRYHAAARTFLFVLDPMSAPGFWDSLTDADTSTVDSTLASPVHPQGVFDNAVQQMIAMGARLRRSRLIVAISKTDLIEHTKLFEEREDTGQWARWWLTERLGLGNLVRSMEREFADVQFFFTAAVTVAPRRVHESVPPFVTCALGLPTR